MARYVDNIIEHLKNRGIDPERVKVYVDPERNVATFPIYAPNGRMIGYQQYNPNEQKLSKNKDVGRYFTWISDAYKTCAMWGMETLARPGPIFIAEGIFDIVKVHNAGYAGLAVLSNDPNHSLRGQLKLFRREIIAILDRDKAGAKLAKNANRSYLIPEPYKDLGEMPQEEVNIFLAGILGKF